MRRLRTALQTRHMLRAIAWCGLGSLTTLEVLFFAAPRFPILNGTAGSTAQLIAAAAALACLAVVVHAAAKESTLRTIASIAAGFTIMFVAAESLRTGPAQAAIELVGALVVAAGLWLLVRCTRHLVSRASVFTAQRAITAFGLSELLWVVVQQSSSGTVAVPFGTGLHMATTAMFIALFGKYVLDVTSCVGTPSGGINWSRALKSEIRAAAADPEFADAAVVLGDVDLILDRVSSASARFHRPVLGPHRWSQPQDEE